MVTARPRARTIQGVGARIQAGTAGPP